MDQLQLSYHLSYRDYISLVNARYSRVVLRIEKRNGDRLPHWAKILLKPVVLAWAVYNFIFVKNRTADIKISIDRSDIELTVKKKMKRISWNCLADIERHKTGYILVLPDDSGILIPKRVMNVSQITTIDSLITDWNADRQSKQLATDINNS